MRQLSEFEGVWQLSRQIEDARAGLSGHLQGEARFEQGQGGLILTERGQLTYGLGAPLQAERRYLWREEAGGIAVFFEDGRPFHWFSAEETEASHDCPPDLYHVSYDFNHWPQWRARWQVSGPRKDYMMESCYTRQSEAPD
ncbi:DUF6314 family protein [Nioella aestuarii]|uniref:DUF6314 family protein n=1 Tax=Nioella aestuarii TaxID=1662864 RepID=UPI003D7F8362